MTAYVIGSILLLLLAAGLVYRSIMWPGVMKIGGGSTCVSCVGDSITFGLGVFPFRRKRSYQAFLAELMGEDYTFFNYGLTNRTLLPVGKDYYFNEKIGKIAWNTPADILIFMLGTNDSKRTLWDEDLFEKKYFDVIEHYKQMGCFKQIYIMIPPRVFDENPGKRGCNTEIIREKIIPIVRRVAAACDVELIDLYSLTEQHSEWFPDKLHPNRDGNRAIAEEIAKHMRMNCGAASSKPC